MHGKKELGVGGHIAAARRQAGMTQEELAALLHVTRQTVSNYESMRSQPDIQTLVRLADCLRVPVEELIYGRQTRRSPRFFGGLAAFCRGLGIAAYLLGGCWGIRQGSGVRQVGENGVAYAFDLWGALPVWIGALLCGTALLALGGILFRLEEMESIRQPEE